MSTVFRLPQGKTSPDHQQRVVRAVLFVASGLGEDSASHQILRLARELRRRGKEVGLACAGGPLTDRFEKIGISPLVARSLAYPRAAFLPARGLLAHARHLAPEVLHFFGRPLAGWALRLSRVLGLPYALSITTFATGRAPLKGDWRRGAVLTYSEELREELVNHDRVPKGAIALIPAGISLPDYERYRDSNGSSEVPVVGTVGPLVPERGCEYFLRAAREILDRGRQVQFLVAGDGPQLPRLRQLARQLQLDHHITFTQHFDDYRSMLAVLDVCVLSALQEGLSLNVLEAIACRKPVVATGAGPVCGIIKDGETGFLAPKKAPTAIAEKVLKLLDDEGLRRKIVDAAYEMVRQRYSIEASVQSLLRFYSWCVARAEVA